LSRIQLDIVQNKIKDLEPDVQIQVNYRESLGDQLKDTPLHTQDGTDFFTQAIAGELDAGTADMAVHSLKDMSGAHFFGEHRFAVVDREDARDLAIFNPDIIDRLKEGKPIRIGTCSFRRETMATEFLSKALPYFGKTKQLTTLNIRGNVDTRLKKLDRGEYDGILLAVAGVNRLLKEESTKKEIADLLRNKKIMVLPVIECVPAPCQGAIVAETSADNEKACTILDKINNTTLYEDCLAEKKIALTYGAGCIQHFGVTTVKSGNETWRFASGIDQYGRTFEDWYGIHIPDINFPANSIIGSEELGFKANRTYVALDSGLPDSKAYFIAHSAVLECAIDKRQYSGSRIWTAGTSSWIKLAGQGIWVEGCADSMGLNSIESLLNSPLIDLKMDDLLVLTNVTSAERWQSTGWKSQGTYDIRYESSLIDKYKLQSAKMVFWNCYAHLDAVKELIPQGLVHACLPGRTGDLLRQQGINPVLFPTLAAFIQWKKKYSLSHIAA
jgi:hydroxymethylbilane synthase